MDFEVNAKKKVNAKRYLYIYGEYQANTSAQNYHFNTENLRGIGSLNSFV